MSTLTLPGKDSPDIRLVVGTPEEVATQTNINSTEWREALSLDAYLRREDLLSQQDLTKDGGLTPWMLVYQSKDATSRHVLCGCESIRKRAIVARRGVLKEVISHSVASVFCPSAARGRGYAGRMMTELTKRLKDWQTEGGEEVGFSVLYSDIGKVRRRMMVIPLLHVLISTQDFYARRGWQVFPSAHISLPPTSQISTKAQFATKLETKDLASLCRSDEQILRTRLGSVKDSSRTTVALIPDAKVLAWHHARECFVANELLHKSPADRGAIVGEPGSRVWCYWMRVWGNPQDEAPNTMHIVRMVVEEAAFPDLGPATEEGVASARGSKVVENIATLLATAQTIASLWGMHEVMLWNPTSATLAAVKTLDPKAAVVHRESKSITSLLWYGEGEWSNVDWVCNEKYSWC